MHCFRAIEQIRVYKFLALSPILPFVAFLGHQFRRK